jgi:hypothetical protein
MGRSANVFGGETIPQPLVEELGQEDAWDEWSRAVQQQEVGFAPTAPAGLGFAPTAPAGLEPMASPHRAAPTPAAPARLTLDKVMAEIRRNARVCPQPPQWMKLYVVLARYRSGDSRMPSPPLSGPVWNAAPVSAKRMCLIEQLEWADKQGCLQPVFELLQELKEDQWYYAG